MTWSIGISVGQYSDRGRKAVNQDFHGFCMPAEPQRGLKGIAFAVADGIGSSAVSHIASETAVRNFLDDYYCTSEAWSVRTAGEQVLNAINSWLWAQTRRSEHRYDRDRGYVCTLSALVLKGEQAHLFHVGDSRIYRLRDGALEQLTHDHRLWLSSRESYLSRALGSAKTLELDYRRLALRAGDIFILTTDGVHEYVDADAIVAAVQAHPDDLDAAAQATACQALDRGSPDNLTLQILRIDSLPRLEVRDFERQAGQLPLPPLLEAGQAFDGYRIVRELHASSRSHVYLAEDEQSGARVALKIPSIDQRDDPAYLERLLLEEWIARRLDSPHVLAAARPARGRGYLYTATEYVEGRTLAQWLRDTPAPTSKRCAASSSRSPAACAPFTAWRCCTRT
ncbi:protein phosphatase 2C domain-containing protein [Marinobacterium aestuariivivens]|uniref:Protein phosphatase 2C domain-containing protein n=1 Tax=Marinobacterium aestuariivivens TaxID=1698799 RepID=A0ABW1ZW79_9GAMM